VIPVRCCETGEMPCGMLFANQRSLLPISLVSFFQRYRSGRQAWISLDHYLERCGAGPGSRAVSRDLVETSQCGWLRPRCPDNARISKTSLLLTSQTRSSKSGTLISSVYSGWVSHLSGSLEPVAQHETGCQRSHVNLWLSTASTGEGLVQCDEPASTCVTQ
jgi:hypothetical protein